VFAAVFSALHLIALGIGLGSVWMRGRALRSPTFDRPAIRRVLAADNVWGIAALLWIGTGLTRVLAGLDKDVDFYVHNGLFWVKMGLFALLFALEILPMITFIRWRVVTGSGGTPDTSRVSVFARINDLEVALVVLIVFVAAMMARGLWLLP
jgi:putative membrane protein